MKNVLIACSIFYLSLLLLGCQRDEKVSDFNPDKAFFDENAMLRTEPETSLVVPCATLNPVFGLIYNLDESVCYNLEGFNDLLDCAGYSGSDISFLTTTYLHNATYCIPATLLSVSEQISATAPENCPSQFSVPSSVTDPFCYTSYIIGNSNLEGLQPRLGNGCVGGDIDVFETLISKRNINGCFFVRYPITHANFKLKYPNGSIVSFSLTSQQFDNALSTAGYSTSQITGIRESIAKGTMSVRNFWNLFQFSIAPFAGGVSNPTSLKLTWCLFGCGWPSSNSDYWSVYSVFGQGSLCPAGP